MTNHRGPQYLNADGSFTRKRPGLPRQNTSEARAFSKQLELNKPKKIDPETARMLAKALKGFLG